jgi:hypothetical protein
MSKKRATYHQKQEFIFDLLDSGHDIHIFVGYALSRLSWREVQDIGSHMARIKNDNDKAELALYIKRTEQAYGFRTDEETVNA